MYPVGFLQYLFKIRTQVLLVTVISISVTELFSHVS